MPQLILEMEVLKLMSAMLRPQFIQVLFFSPLSLSLWRLRFKEYNSSEYSKSSSSLTQGNAFLPFQEQTSKENSSSSNNNKQQTTNKQTTCNSINDYLSFLASNTKIRSGNNENGKNFQLNGHPTNIYCGG